MAESDSILVHHQIPTAIGSGAGSVEHKTRCLIQQFLVEAKSAEHVTSIMSNIVATCLDMGTEMSIPDVVGPSAAEYMASWGYEADGHLEADHEDLSEMPAAGAPARLGQNTPLMPKTMIIPGILHVLDNMVEQMNADLPGYESWLGGFKALA